MFVSVNNKGIQVMYTNNQSEDNYDHINNSLIYSTTNIPGPGCNMNDFNSCPNQMCNCTDLCHTPNCECVGSIGYSNYDNSGKLVSINKCIYECNDLCKCTSCENRIVQLRPRIGLRIAHCNKGFGLYTNNVIEKGQFVCEYAGEIIDITEAQRRSNLDNENYIFVINEHFSDNVTTTVIDATVIGNIGRYINHSCRPNCMIIPVRVDSLIPRLAIFAIKDIQCNEEITYHYGGERSCPQNNLSAVVCLCESFNCTGFLPHKTGLF